MTITEHQPTEMRNDQQRAQDAALDAFVTMTQAGWDGFAAMTWYALRSATALHEMLWAPYVVGVDAMLAAGRRTAIEGQRPLRDAVSSANQAMPTAVAAATEQLAEVARDAHAPGVESVEAAVRVATAEIEDAAQRANRAAQTSRVVPTVSGERASEAPTSGGRRAK